MEILNFIKKHILFAAVGCAAFTASAQQELSLYPFTDVWHSTSLNPAFFPENKHLAIGLPAFGVDAAHSGDVSYNDLFRRGADDRLILDLGQLIGRLDPENTVDYSQRVETVSLGLRLPGKFAVQVSHALRLNASFLYPRSLAELLWNGNGPYIGQTLNISMDADVYDWQELAIGLSKQIGSVRVGARIKYLAGVSALKTDKEHRLATVKTDDDIYQLTLNTDYGFHAASIVSAIDTAGLGFDIVTNDLKSKFFSENNGLAFDLGFQAKLSERLTVSASVLDLGGTLKWKENANYFRSQGLYTYEGAVFPGADIINNSDSLDFSTKLDTLNDIFKFNKTASSFSSKLPLRFYAGAAFKLSERWQFGLTLFHQNSEERDLTALGANARWAPLRWLSVGAMYSVNNRSATDLGLQLVLKPGPVQVYLLSDNVLNAFTPYASPRVNFRAGLGLVF